MAEAIIKRVFDTVRSNRNIDIISVNNDHGARFIEAVIAVDGKPLRVDLGCAVTIEAKRFDGASKAFSGSVNEDGTVKAPITQWMLEIPNTGVDATISVTTTKPSKLSTTNFTINVQDSPYKGEEISPDDPEYDVLMQVLAGEAEREAAEAVRQSNEAERETAEQIRQKNEAERAKQKQLFSNALKGKKSGGIVAMSDISPLEHTLDVRAVGAVKVKKLGKNLIPYPYANTTRTENGVTFTDNGDGSIIINGTPTIDTGFMMRSAANPLILNVGSYRMSLNADKQTNASVYASTASGLTISSNANNATNITESTQTTYISIIAKGGTTYDNVKVSPQLELGTAATEFEPYIEPVEYPVNADGTVEGVLPIYPTTTLMTDTAGAVVDVEYNRDVNKAFAELYNTIISLGGNV